MIWFLRGPNQIAQKMSKLSNFSACSRCAEMNYQDYKVEVWSGITLLCAVYVFRFNYI